MPNIYWDNNASTNLSDPVIEAMRPWVDGSLFGNPHAGHVMGQTSRDAMNLARERVLSIFGLASDADWQCVFTSGASESNNMALKGIIFNKIFQEKYADPEESPITIITTAVEHSSVDNTLYWLRDFFAPRVSLVFLPVDEHGVVDLVAADRVLSTVNSAVLCTCIHVVAETGAAQPIVGITHLVKSKFPTIVFHTDASQSVGKLDNDILIDIAKHVDLITVAGHKFHGPKGVGALLMKKDVGLTPLIHGAGQEYGLRGGTENVANIVGLGAACAEIGGMYDASTLEHMIECVIAEFQKHKIRDYRINSTASSRSPYTLNLSVAGLNGPVLVKKLGNRDGNGVNICISAGSACHSRGTPTPSKVLSAMGMSPQYSSAGIRLSISKSTSEKEIDDVVPQLVAAMRESMQ